VIGVGAGLILAIAVSRLLLDAHSLAEVGLGLMIGIVSLALAGQNTCKPRIRKCGRC
jgi:hypothetical protein